MLLQHSRASKLIAQRFYHEIQAFFGRCVTVEEHNVFSILELSQMFLVSWPNDHLEVAGNVGRIVDSFASSRVANFVGNVKMKFHIAEVENDGMIEDKKAFDDENVQETVLLDDFLEVAVFVVGQRQIISELSSKQPRLLLIRMTDEMMREKILVIRHQRTRPCLVEQELRAENLHHVFDHFFHVHRLDDFPVQVVEFLDDLMLRVINLPEVHVLVHELHSSELNSSF